MTGFSVVRRRSVPSGQRPFYCIYIGFFCCPPTLRPKVRHPFRILGASRTRGMTPSIHLYYMQNKQKSQQGTLENYFVCIFPVWRSISCRCINVNSQVEFSPPSVFSQFFSFVFCMRCYNTNILGVFPQAGGGSTETKDLQAMERDILLDNFASLTVRQAIRFPLVGERPKPPKNPDGCFRLPSKVRQTLRRSAQKEMPQAVSHDTACGMVFISPATVRSGVFPLRAPAVQRQSGADCLHFS